MTYEPARLGCVEGFAVAYMHRTSGNEQEITGTFRARRSMTAVLIASEGNIVYTGLVEDETILRQVEVFVTVRSYGKVANFQSCGAPVLAKVDHD